MATGGSGVSQRFGWRNGNVALPPISPLRASAGTMQHALNRRLERAAFQKAQNHAQPLSLTCLNIARYEPGSLLCPEAVFAGATRPPAHRNLSTYQLSAPLSSSRPPHAIGSSVSYLLSEAAPCLVKYGLQACPLR